MMRTPRSWAVAVRKPDGSIHTERHDDPTTQIGGILRGPRMIAAGLRVGIHAVRIALRETSGAEPTSEEVAVTFGAGGLAVLAIFVVAPGIAIPGRTIAGAAIEASIRVAMLVAYLLVISRSAQTRQILRYHGAEHKTVAAFERTHRVPTPDEARMCSPIHMRCGTEFIALFVIVAGFVFAVLPRQPLWVGALTRVVLAPVVVALAYELMRAAAHERTALWARALTWPGRALQRLTTREPDADELDVAVAALSALLG